MPRLFKSDAEVLAEYLRLQRPIEPVYVHAAPLSGEFTKEFPLMSADQYRALQPPSPLVHGMIPKASLACLFGEPGIGKSFLGIDLACSIASGQPWLSRTVEQGNVVYVAAEGAYGCSTRIAAWQHAYNVQGSLPLYLFGRAIDLAAKDAAKDFLRGLKSRLPDITNLRLIVIDTLARCMGGVNENVAGDMNRVIETANEIQQETGATVLFIHHPTKGSDGKPSRTERGSGALRGAVDVHMELHGSTDLTLKCIKAKDLPKFDNVSLKRCRYDEQGSCLMIPLSGTSLFIHKDRNALDEHVINILDVLMHHFDGNARSTAWESVCKTELNIARGTFHKALTVAAAMGFVVKGDRTIDPYQLTAEGTDHLTEASPRRSQNVHVSTPITSTPIPPFRGVGNVDEPPNDGGGIPQ